MKERSVILCNTSRGCCPVMTINKDSSVEIRDDYGNTVKMELDQAQLIGKKLGELIENTEDE
jgi:hypothetical protein